MFTLKPHEKNTLITQIKVDLNKEDKLGLVYDL